MLDAGDDVGGVELRGRVIEELEAVAGGEVRAAALAGGDRCATTLLPQDARRLVERERPLGKEEGVVVLVDLGRHHLTERGADLIGDSVRRGDCAAGGAERAGRRPWDDAGHRACRVLRGGGGFGGGLEGRRRERRRRDRQRSDRRTIGRSGSYSRKAAALDRTVLRSVKRVTLSWRATLAAALPMKCSEGTVPSLSVAPAMTAPATAEAAPMAAPATPPPPPSASLTAGAIAAAVEAASAAGSSPATGG